MNTKNYWKDIDLKLSELISNGAVKLPSLKLFDLESLADDISNEMGTSTFKELCSSHKKFLDILGIKEFLTPKLINIAQNIYNFKGNLNNQYHIARKVEPGNSKEMYRAHFDSHIFTLVLPIKIPNSTKQNHSGQLLYFPNARKNPKTEIANFIGKAFHKRYASKEGIEKVSDKYKKIIDDFNDYKPLLFIGKTTLHTNYPVSVDCSSYRLTLLSHFFDDSPKYGIGGLMRFIRNR